MTSPNVGIADSDALRTLQWLQAQGVEQICLKDFPTWPPNPTPLAPRVFFTKACAMAGPQGAAAAEPSCPRG